MGECYGWPGGGLRKQEQCTGGLRLQKPPWLFRIDEANPKFKFTPMFNPYYYKLAEMCSEGMLVVGDGPSNDHGFLTPGRVSVALKI